MRLLRSRILTIAVALPLLLIGLSGAFARTCGGTYEAGHCCDQVPSCGLACAGACQPFSAIEDVAVQIRFETGPVSLLSTPDDLSGIDPAPELPPPR